jgi:DNA-binding IclR family transcriptional regulator
MTKKPQKQTKPTRVTKADKIITLLQRNAGATIMELAKATGWQRHSVHGFMSGNLKKNRGLEIESSKEENKDRRYRIRGAAQ